MILKRILSVSCGVILGIITLYILEGSCFRLVEDYALKRLRWAWGNFLQGSVHPILSKFPLDHFAEPPSNKMEGDVNLESVYSSRIMSFSLAQRDRYLEFIHSENDPLRNFDIRDLQSLRGVITPGLTRPAMYEDVRDGIARRAGDLLEYAEGFSFLLLVPQVIPIMSINLHNGKRHLFFYLMREWHVYCWPPIPSKT